MSFQTKLFLTYYLLIILLVVILGLCFYHYASKVYEDNAFSNLEVIVDKMSQQLDHLIQPMDLITTYLLSTEGFMSSVVSLATIDRTNPQNQLYISESRATIYGNVLNYTTDKNFYRVSFFNREGDFLTSNFKVKNINKNVREFINNLKWIDQADAAKGKVIVIPPYTDPWSVSPKAKVFGIARSIQGFKSGIGYIEVQNPYTELEKIFAIPDDNMKVLALTKTGEVFFSNGEVDEALISYSEKVDSRRKRYSSMERNPLTGAQEFVVAAMSDYTGVKILLVQDRNALLKPLTNVINISIAIFVIILIVSLGYIYIFSRQLAKPVRELKEKMESTELENLPEKITFESSNDEFEALNRSFQHLRERLNEAIKREIKAQTLQIQASFDSLQAQVNPHFLYNILNVLSNKGIVNEDYEICEICDSIAAMLRYSTSTLKRTATIAEELEHTRKYLMLMKKRFEHRLEFEINVDSGIYNAIIPKIVLQQIVENSINHGFENLQTIMRISVKGYASEGWWYIEITDNGQGFAPDVLNQLKTKMEEVKKELSGAESYKGLEIGGMGLINTYARLLLFLDGKFVFKLENAEDGGAKVTIGGILESAKEDDKNGESIPG